MAERGLCIWRSMAPAACRGGGDGWQFQLLNVGVLQIHKEQNQMTK
jgi:hypothetical protein